MKIEDIKYDLHDKTVNDIDFDLEKWKIENPIDYFKFMYLINTSLDKNTAFKTIYQISRLYMPNTLFKYYSLTDDTSLNKQKLDTLLQQKVFMSNVKSLNDPFDSKAYFYRPEELKKYERLAIHDGKLIDDFAAYTKVCSFSTNGINSMPMWAHYANNHCGFCVSYDTKINWDLASCTFPVQYTSERIDITSVMDEQVKKALLELELQTKQGRKKIILDDLSLIFLTTYFCNIKHTSWSYENEFRCTIGNSTQIPSYMPAQPKEIYIGKNCKQTYIDKLTNIAKKLHIPIFKMYFDDLNNEFNLTAKKLQ